MAMCYAASLPHTHFPLCLSLSFHSFIFAFVCAYSKVQSPTNKAASNKEARDRRNKQWTRKRVVSLRVHCLCAPAVWGPPDLPFRGGIWSVLSLSHPACSLAHSRPPFCRAFNLSFFLPLPFALCPLHNVLISTLQSIKPTLFLGQR